ncbi:MAG: hypothetical protein ACFNUB_03025 [Candidatus Saccharibacteria bacterium]
MSAEKNKIKLSAPESSISEQSSEKEKPKFSNRDKTIAHSISYRLNKRLSEEDILNSENQDIIDLREHINTGLTDVINEANRQQLKPGSQERIESIKDGARDLLNSIDFDSFADKLGLPESSKNKERKLDKWRQSVSRKMGMVATRGIGAIQSMGKKIESVKDAVGDLKEKSAKNKAERIEEAKRKDITEFLDSAGEIAFRLHSIKAGISLASEALSNIKTEYKHLRSLYSNLGEDINSDVAASYFAKDLGFSDKYHENIKLLNNEIKKRKSDEKEAKKSAKLAEKQAKKDAKQAKKPKYAKPRKPISLDSIPLIPRYGEPGETKQEENLRYRKNTYKLGAIALTGIITFGAMSGGVYAYNRSANIKPSAEISTNYNTNNKSTEEAATSTTKAPETASPEKVAETNTTEKETLFNTSKEGKYGNLFSGYNAEKDIAGMSGKIDKNDWRKPLEGDSTHERGKDFLDGLKSSPSELATVLSRLGSLPEGMTVDEAQKVFSNDKDRAITLASVLSEGKVEFKQGSALGENEAYGSYFAVKDVDGVYRTYYDSYVDGSQPSNVLEIHVTKDDGSTHVLEIREACGQIIDRIDSNLDV